MLLKIKIPNGRGASRLGIALLAVIALGIAFAKPIQRGYKQISDPIKARWEWVTGDELMGLSERDTRRYGCTYVYQIKATTDGTGWANKPDKEIGTHAFVVRSKRSAEPGQYEHTMEILKCTNIDSWLAAVGWIRVSEAGSS